MNRIDIIMILVYDLTFILYYRTLFPVQKGGQIYIVLSVAAVLAIYAFLNTQALCIFRIPAIMATISIGLRLSTSMGWMQAVYGGSFCVLSAYCIRGICITVCSLIFRINILTPEATMQGWITIFSLPLAFLIFAALRRTIFPDSKIKKLLSNSSQLKLIVIYEIIAAINLTIILWGRDLTSCDVLYPGPLSAHSMWEVQVSLGNCILTLCMLIYAVYQSIQSTELLEYRCRTKILEKQYEQQLRHYKSYQKYTGSFRAFLHDYKYMIVSLQALIRAQENEKAIQLIDGLYDDMQSRVAVHKKYSNNVILDAILQDVANICMEKEIRFQFNTIVPSDTGLTRLDAIRIFSNIAKNAVEACEKVPVSDRFIEITSGNDDQWAMLEAVNSYDGNVLIDDGRLMTTKSERDGHGLGLGIVQDITENLGGFVVYDADAERRAFIIRVHIPRISKNGQKFLVWE